MNILITGASGNVGGAALTHLLKGDLSGHHLYIGSHNPGKETYDDPKIKEVRKLDFQDKRTFASAVQGIDKVFLVRPPQLADVRQYFEPFLDVLLEQQIGQIVFLSLQGADKNPITPHRKIEKAILKLQLDYVFLRPSFFMENMTTTHLKEIRDKDEIYIPAGKGKTNFIAVGDIGEVAAQVLLCSQYHKAAFELTGPKAYDYYEIAEVISKVTGRRIPYKNPSLLSFFIRKTMQGQKFGFTLIMADLYTVARFGKAAGYSEDLKALLGREGQEFEAFAWEHRESWMQG